MESTNKLTKTKYENLYCRVIDKANHHYLRFYKNGKQFKKLISIGKTHKEANIIAIQTKALIEEQYTQSIKDTFGNLFRKLQLSSQGSVKENYIHTREITYNKHLNHLSNISIANITAEELQMLINDKLRTHKPATVYQIKQIISNVYKQQNYLPNLGYSIMFPKFDNTVYFNMHIDDARRLYKAIQEYPDATYRSLFMFGLQGRRKAEIAYLRWADIDFKNKRYYVRPELSKANIHSIFELSDEHIETLQQIECNSDFIHLNSAGKPLYYFRKRWIKLLKDNDIPYMRFHDLRHMLGGIAINAGYSLEFIAQALGHKTTQVTKRYSRLKNTAGNEVVQAVNKLLS